VIVDMQFPCHSTPRPLPPQVPMRGTHEATCQAGQCRSGHPQLCGEDGAVETAALLRRVHYAKF
jgi:hypothetical protein